MKTESGKDKMVTLVGKGVSPGLAKGKAFVYIDDLSRRLLLSLAGIHAHSLENLTANTVLVARRLLPSDTVFLSRSSTVAVLAEFAGPATHAALLARELGIPCVGGIPELLETVHTGDVVLLNGAEGTAVINPDSQALQRYERSLGEARKRKETMAQVSLTGRTVTLDGIEVSVMANVRSREDVALAMERGADGIGLFRTEPFFLSAKHFPSDNEFAEFLLGSLHSARGRHIDIRLLDKEFKFLTAFLPRPSWTKNLTSESTCRL